MAAESLPIEPGRVLQVPINDIAPDPDQPRRVFHEKPLQELAANIKARGILQPITARIADDGAMLIKSGERRWRAAQLAGLDEVPVLLDLVPEDAPDRLVDQVVENELREQLSPLELAAALGRLRDAGMTPSKIQAHLAEHGLTYSRSMISNTLRLLELPDWARECVENGEIGSAHARAVLSAKDHPAWMTEVKALYEDRRHWNGNVTVNEMEHIVSRALHDRDIARRLDPHWPKPKFDWQSVCKGCPHLVKHGDGNWCLNPPEFDRRVAEADAAAEASTAAAMKPEKPETDPKKVKPRRLKENDDGIVPLKGKPYESYQRLSHAEFDVETKCAGCPHKRRGEAQGVADFAEDVCFYPPCFENLELEVRKDAARAVKFKEALDELLLPVLVEQVREDRSVQQALIAYMFVGQPLAGRPPKGNVNYLPRAHPGYDLVPALHDQGSRVVWNLTETLEQYARGGLPSEPLALIALPRLHHEQRRELAQWLEIPLDAFYRPTEALAKLYKKAELIDLIDPDGDLEWTPALASRPVGELRTMFLQHVAAAPAQLEGIWNSPIANLSGGIEDEEPACRYCFCTPLDPCDLDDGPCGWHVQPAATTEGSIEGVCTNPQCLAKLAEEEPQ